MNQANSRSEVNVWKGLVAGFIGGLVGSYIMNQFQTGWSQLSSEGSSNGQSGEQAGQQKNGDQQQSASESQDQEPATVKAATAISEGLFNHPLSQEEKQIAGPSVHYTFGATVGAAYGLLAEVAPQVTMGVGLPFAAVLWLLADEAAVPVLGLSKPPTTYPPSMHTYALASHLVYGLATEGTRRAVRQAL